MSYPRPLCLLGDDPRGKTHELMADGRTLCEHMTTGTWSRTYCKVKALLRRGTPTCDWCRR